MKSRIALVAGAIVLGSASCSAQDSSADALKLLQQMAEHYRDAQYIRLDAIERNTTHSSRRDTVETGAYSATLAPGERYRYTGDDGFGSSELVSDGTQEWHLLNGFGEYAKDVAGNWLNHPVSIAGDNRSLYEAKGLPGTFSSIDVGVQSAHFLPDETLEQAGKPVRCKVIRVNSSESTQRQTPGVEWQKTVWLDKASLRVIKAERVVRTKPFFGDKVQPNGPEITEVFTTIFTVSDLNYEPHADTFTFKPPADAHEVAKLPTGFFGPPPPGRDRLKIEGAAYLGKPLPEITLKDAAGTDVSFSRYRGHPLLIDVWATWCGPCISEMPALQHIRKSTSETDLQMVAVDQDLHSSDAVALLKERGYDWPDFAYTVPFVRALSISGIPLLVLVDADGKIVYYHSGADDAKGLAEAIAKLGPAYAGVRMD